MLGDELTNEEMEILKGEKEESQMVQESTPVMDYQADKGEAEAKPEEDYKSKYDSVVGALTKERDNRRQLQEKLDKITDRLLAVQEQREMAQAKPTEPDYETDPIGYLKWENEKLKETVSKQGQLTQEQQDFLIRKSQHEQIMSAYQQASAMFRSSQPDYDEAKKFVIGQRDSELRILGINDPGQRAEILRNEEAALIRQAFSSNINPAEMIYTVARHRGYTGQQGQQESNTPATNTFSQGTKSLSTIRGGAVQKQGSLQEKAQKIINMSDKEFFNIPADELESILKKI